MINSDISKLLDEALMKETKFIGDVYRLIKQGKKRQEIASILGHKNSLTVVNFGHTIKALFGQTQITSLGYTSKKNLISSAKKLQKDNDNNLLISHLQGLINQATNQVSSSVPIPALPSGSPSLNSSQNPIIETPVVGESNKTSEENQIRSGVYVYSYPQYLSMESISPDGRALYKIGASNNTSQRLERQRRQTEVPEDLVLVRVFHCENSFETERKFHNILSAANLHHKNTAGGVEWFNCNLATIDAIAKALYLVNEA